MKKSRQTKRALIPSVLAVILCVAMFIGTTFAWFTDTASTSVNKIQAGKLDVELVKPTANNDNTYDALGTAPLKWVKADGHTEEEVLWEPGATYNLESFRIQNNGNLALKYKVQISGIVGNAELLKAIDFTVKIGGGEAKRLENWTGTLAADAVTDEITITGTMKTTAGNEYQGESITGISITVLATQDTVEYDSEGNTYDEGATYDTIDAIPVAAEKTVETQKDTNNNIVTKEAATVKTNEKVSDDESADPVAQASIPAGVKTTATAEGTTTVTLSVTPTVNTASGTTVTTGQGSKSYEIKLDGISEQNTTEITVTFYTDTGLNNVKVYHDGKEMGSGKYSYDSDTGKVTVTSATFSPFDIVYDKPIYPEGVTKESFPESVQDATTTGTINVPATAAYVDNSGDVQYVADVTDAIKAGAEIIYLKENETVKLSDPEATNRTSDLTRDLTIYANGADFQDGQVSMNMTDAGKAEGLTLEIHDAKNIYVWGSSPNAGVTQTVILENCHNVGSSATDSNARMFYLTGDTGTVNVTLRNCSVTNAEAPVYMNCNGSVTVENCSFSECASAMKLSLKAESGTTAVTVSDTTFDKCGYTGETTENTKYLTEDSSSIKIKTKSSNGATLTLNNVAVTNVVGSNSIVVDGESDYTGKTTVSAANVTVGGTEWTYTAPTTT